MRMMISNGADVPLALVDGPEPRPASGQVAIGVQAAGVGRVDLLMRRAIPTPFSPGLEVAGRILAVGEGVEPSLVGRRVFARVPMGGYADVVLADARQIVDVPAAITDTQAVAAGVNALVAHFALERARVRSRETVLVRGASGGIGHLVVQMAETREAHVIAGSSNEPVAADAIIDLVAGPATTEFARLLNPNGRYVLAGISAGMPPEDLGRVLVDGFRRSLSISTMSLDTVPDKELNDAAATIFASIEAGTLKPSVAREFALADADQAHGYLASGSHFGKVILRPEGL